MNKECTCMCMSVCVCVVIGDILINLVRNF